MGSQNNFKGVIKVPYNEQIHELSKLLPNNKNKIIFSYPNKLSNKLVNVSQKTESKSHAGVYTIPCNHCDKIYVGQTGRNINTRILEHKRAVRYAQSNSAIFNHIQEENHTIDWNNTSLVFKSNCSYRRKILESVYISQTNNFNLSQGQWLPDAISLSASLRLLPRIPTPTSLPYQPRGHVT